MASYLRSVAVNPSSTGNTENPSNDLVKRLAKWALIIGVPTAVCVAAYLVYRKQQQQQGSNRGTSSTSNEGTLPTPLSGGASATASGDAATHRTKTPLALVMDLKNEGNAKYRDNNFYGAIESYTKAIEGCPRESTEELSQFYQNRAAAWQALSKYDKVIEDCSHAIDLNPKYIKCIQRRARAAESVGNYELALEDYSTVCFIDSYQPAYVLAADKVLTDLAKRFVQNLPPSTAELSKDYVRTSLNEFEDDPVMNPLFMREIRAAQENSPLARAYQAFDESRFTDIPSLCSQEIDASSPYRLHALLFRGSFYLLMGNYVEAIEDFDAVANSNDATELMKINAELKRANAKIHQRDLEGALNEYDQCILNHPNSCAPRIHRGMLKTLLENYSEAHDDFEAALQISPTNLRARYQKLINDAKIGAKENRPERVEQTLASFEEYFQTCKQDIYYALALTSCYLDNDRKEKALEYLNKFVREIPDNPTLLALKANCLMANDPSNSNEAEQLYKEALRLDPSNETVLTMFAIFNCNRNQFEDASNLYERAIHCTRGEEKLMQYAALFYAIRAQGRAIKRLNLTFPTGFPGGAGGPLPGFLGGMQ